MRKKNTVITITSLLVITLFIGAALPSAIADSLSSEETVEECSSCVVSPSRPRGDFPCDTCKEAVYYAVDYMKDHVKENVDGIYFLWTVDVVILISEGLIEGFKESGFRIEIDEDELRANIEYWVNKTVGPQKFTVTLFFAKLGAIVIGVTAYLISLCYDDDAQNRPATTQPSRTISRIMSLLYRWIKVLHLLGL